MSEPLVRHWKKGCTCGGHLLADNAPPRTRICDTCNEVWVLTSPSYGGYAKGKDMLRLMQKEPAEEIKYGTRIGDPTALAMERQDILQKLETREDSK